MYEIAFDIFNTIKLETIPPNMAAKVRVTNVAVLNNPCKFLEPFQFQITFECLELEHDLEWKLLYVGSAENHDHDQILDTVLVGGIKAGTNLIG